MSGDDLAKALEHPDMIYSDFVEEAMNSEEPVTEIRPVGDTRNVYSAAQYDPETEICWRADIDYDPRWGSPSVGFSRCRPTADYDTFREWTPLATGRLSGPQNLSPWESMFTVFNVALIFFNKERDDG